MLIRHGGIYVGAKLLPGVLGMATTALLTRLMTPELYGRYGAALVIMSFGTAVGFEWLGLAYLRLAPGLADPARAAGTFNRLFAAVLLLALAVGAGAVAVTPMADRSTVAAGLALMGSYAWFEFRARLPVAGLAPGAYLRMNLLRAVLILLAAGGTAFLTGDPVSTAFATALATLAASVAGGGAVRGAGFDRVLARTVLAFGLPLAASLALNSAAGSLTRALVGGLGGVEALGLYTAGFVLVQNTLVVLSSGLAAAGFSLAVRALEAGGPAAARRQLAANGTLLLAVLAPAALGMALTADGMAALLVGPAFRAPVAALTPWLAAGAFLTGLRAHYLEHAFQLGNRIGGQIGVTATAAVVTLGLDAALIPRAGAVGAAVAVAAGSFAAAIHAAVAGRAAFAIPLPIGQAARVAGACGVMAASVLTVPAVLLMQVPAGVAAYGAAALVLDVGGSRGALLRRLLPPGRTA